MASFELPLPGGEIVSRRRCCACNGLDGGDWRLSSSAFGGRLIRGEGDGVVSEAALPATDGERGLGAAGTGSGGFCSLLSARAGYVLELLDVICI